MRGCHRYKSRQFTNCLTTNDRLQQIRCRDVDVMSHAGQNVYLNLLHPSCNE